MNALTEHRIRKLLADLVALDTLVLRQLADISVELNQLNGAARELQAILRKTALVADAGEQTP
jgi:hypothetical protein